MRTWTTAPCSNSGPQSQRGSTVLTLNPVVRVEAPLRAIPSSRRPGGSSNSGLYRSEASQFQLLACLFSFQYYLTDCCLVQEKQAATNRILLKKERASGFQDSRLDVVARFNGSTEALDRLDDPPAPPPAPSLAAPTAAASVGPHDAVSPTVSQLSAVFEKSQPQNNLYLPQRRPGPALAPKPKPPARAEAGGRKVGGIWFTLKKHYKLQLK